MHHAAAWAIWNGSFESGHTIQKVWDLHNRKFKAEEIQTGEWIRSKIDSQLFKTFVFKVLHILFVPCDSKFDISMFWLEDSYLS